MRPVIATAASSDSWYSWCSEALFNKDYTGNSKLTLDDLVPFESSNLEERQSTKRVCIGHNVGFDRSFIREQYFLEVNFKIKIKLNQTKRVLTRKAHFDF